MEHPKVRLIGRSLHDSEQERSKFRSARRVMRESLIDLHALAQALDDAEGLGDVLDEALGLTETEAKKAIQAYCAALRALK